MRVVKNDTIKVVSGKYKGKISKVLKVFPDKDRVIVEGVNIIKKHTRPSQKNTQGGIVEKEAPIHISNVVLVCGKCNKPTRVGYRFLDDGSKVRFCKNKDCGEIISVNV
ncbi:MAG: 50S ribosomal protein L24 [Calditrichaceae bacterium]